MYQVEYFADLIASNLQRNINNWLNQHPHIIPINISINGNGLQAMLLYKKEE